MSPSTPTTTPRPPRPAIGPSIRSGRTGRLAGAGVVGLVLVLAGTSAGASSPCLRVKGSYDEHFEAAGCTSEVSFCIAGTYEGDIEGDFFGSATSFFTTIDSETTGVQGFTADSVVEAQIRRRQGTLTIKNAGVFQPTGAGNIVDLQVVTGGTGDFEDATGAIRASGTFVAGAGTSRYQGEICLPED